ncbi:MAG: pilus assembly protein PilM [bacterium]
MFVRRRILGIEMGAHAIKVVQVRTGSGDRVVLEKSAYLPWRGSREEPGTSSAEVLKSVVRDCGLSAGRARSALRDPGMTIRRLSLPRMPEAELREALKWKIRKELGEDASEVIVDYVGLGDSAEEGRGQQDLMAFAVKKSALEAHLGLLRETGLRLESVEPLATALLHLCSRLPELSSDQACIVLDCGASQTEWILAHKGRPLFIRHLPFAGQQLTASLQEAFGIEADAAEDMKHRYGIEGKADDKADRPEAARSVAQVLWPQIEELLMEIRYSLGYVQDHLNPAPPLGSILLAGAGSELPGLVALLEKQLGLPCRLLPELAALGLSISGDFEARGPVRSSAGLAAALGLALRKV